MRLHGSLSFCCSTVVGVAPLTEEHHLKGVVPLCSIGRVEMFRSRGKSLPAVSLVVPGVSVMRRSSYRRRHFLRHVPHSVPCVLLFLSDYFWQVLDGVMFNKDVTHSKMRRKIENPRVLLLDCPLEYKKGEVCVGSRPCLQTVPGILQRCCSSVV